MPRAPRLAVAPVASTAPADGGDQVVVLRDVPWEQYEGLLRTIGDRSGVRAAYLDGELELTSPARPHEHWKKLTARLIEAFGDARGLQLNAFGSETHKKKARRAGLEPDESYVVGPEKPIPDLALEVVYRSGGIDKLEIYRRLGVPEVWFWIDSRLHVYRLARDGSVYRRIRRSRALRGIDLALVERLVATSDRSHQSDAVRAFRQSLET